MASLYELTSEYLELLEIAQDADADPQTVRDTMEGLAGELDDKADAYAYIIADLQADIDAAKKEIERLEKIKKSREDNVKRLKEGLQAAMEETGREKIKTRLHSFSVQNNPPRVVIDATKAIPPKWLIPQEPKIDTAGIRDALKKGDNLEFAHLEQGRSLRIR